MITFTKMLYKDPMVLDFTYNKITRPTAIHRLRYVLAQRDRFESLVKPNDEIIQLCIHLNTTVKPREHQIQRLEDLIQSHFGSRIKFAYVFDVYMPRCADCYIVCSLLVF